jgi:D-alanyl-D-alanine carboxypeptidase
MKTIPTHTLDFLDSWLTLRSKWDDAPGFAVAIMKDGEVIFNHAYGKASLETGEPLTMDHRHRIASHSKSFTATALLQLQEAGKLRIDDMVVTYLPWLGEHQDTRWQEVTLRQLMSHGAGVIRDGLDCDYWDLRRPFPDATELKEAVLAADLVFEPNVQMKYSNYGYALLGMVIETAAGQSYTDYVTEHILSPLGLAATTTDLEASDVLATGYTRLTMAHERLAFPHAATNAMAAATGVVSTAAETAKFFDALRPGTGKLLSDASKKEMRHVQWVVKGEHGESYGLGLDIKQRNHRLFHGHSGGFPGFISRTWTDAKDNLTVCVIANAHGTMPSVWAGAIIDLIDEFGDEPPKEEFIKYEVRLTSTYGIRQVIAQPNGLRCIWVSGWWPMDAIETLEVVDETTLKIVHTGGYAYPGELMKYVFNDDGSVHHVIDTGYYAEPTVDGDVRPTWT